MRALHRIVDAALAVALAGCATTSSVEMTPPPTAAPPAGQPFEKTGSVSFDSGGMGASVAYGPWRVVGAGIDVTYAGGGRWAGRLSGDDVVLATSSGRVTGPGTDLALSRSGKDLLLRGTWARRKLDLAVGPERLVGSPDGGSCSFRFAATGPGRLEGDLGCSGASGGKASSAHAALALDGEAVLVPDVLMPQFVLALLAALPQ